MMLSVCRRYAPRTNPTNGGSIDRRSVPDARADARDPCAEAVITGGLAAYNEERFGRVDSRSLDILVRDDNSGEVVGGLLGHSSLGLFFLDLFYLPEALRRSGLGSRIIELAEQEGRRRGCTAAFVCTVTFQAPGF